MSVIGKGVLIAILCVVGIVGLAFGGLAFTGYFSPRYQNVKRNVFEETKSYNQGKIQDLLKYMDEYNRSDEKGKQSIAMVVRQMFADYDEDNLTPEMRAFLKACKY
jgi:hypothetical protein